VVADHLGLVELRQCRSLRPEVLGWDAVQRVLGRVRDLAVAATGPRQLEQGWLELRTGDAPQAAPAAPARAVFRSGPLREASTAAVPPPSSAASASANRRMSSLVVISVAHTSSPSARVGSSGSAFARTSPASTPRSRRRRCTAAAFGTRTANSLRYGA